MNNQYFNDKKRILVRFFIGALLACNLTINAQNNAFTQLTSAQSGVKFTNQLSENQNVNALLYDNIYAGGGVAIGDINNDGLPDIYFAGNQVSDKLYLNQGALKFEDITTTNGIIDNESWSSGVVMADVNGDGWLDIYVCKTLYEEKEKEQLRANQFYVNNGDGTFTEQAEKWGIASTQRSQQATFFDYDKDGDLDLFLVNQPPNPGTFSPLKGYDWRDEQFSCQLFKNEGTTFVDVTKVAGVRAKGYGLCVSSADFNKDGWTDLYVTNDYNSPDFLYINQGDGTFKNTLNESIGHISFFSMGVDAADMNEDGWADVAVLDMVPEDNYRLKANMGGMVPEAFWQTVEEGGHYQYMFNTLQLNRGTDEEGLVHFSDVAQLAGTAYSDWSWSPLFADFDNDGDKDLFCSNGLVRDLRNTDALSNIKAYTQAAIQKFQMENPNVTDANFWDIIDWKVAADLFPSQPLSNYYFQNEGDLKYENKAKEVGLAQPGFSTGAAYGDLDLDGDLDLVVNNINGPAWIFKNEQAGNYLRVEVKDGANISLFGTKIMAEFDGKKHYYELSNARGFYSASEAIAHFGLGEATKVDNLVISWLDGTTSRFKNVKKNQVLVVDKAKGKAKALDKTVPAQLFKNYTSKHLPTIKHEENEYDDYEKEVLLPHKMSQIGPALAVGDLDGNGKEDFFMGGAKGFYGKMYLQTAKGEFRVMDVPALVTDKAYEDVDAVFFDADMDGDLDLYVVSGGNESEANSEAYQDRLYLYEKNTFKKSTALPNITESGSIVKPFDYDNDGDLDLLIGGRQVPGAYPSPANSFIFKNEKKETGTLKFTNITKDIAPELQKIGMVTDANWTDFDSDGDMDFILSGEWMPITFFENTGKTFNKITPLANTSGWWFSVTATDMDNDGDDDYLLGNLGLNSKYKATEIEPFSVHYDDFDENGSYDIVLSYYNFGKKYPVRGRSCSSEQVPALAQSFPTYDLFAQADVFEVYGADKIQQALTLDVQRFDNVWIENKGNKEFEIHSLPRMAQLSTINDWLVLEDKIIAAGNMLNTEVETTRQDGSLGIVLSKDGTLIPTDKTGLFLPQEVKKMKLITVGEKKMILVAGNNTELELWGK